MAEDKQEYLDLEGLTEYHSKVNDMTTGVNLLRGSRDFSKGTTVTSPSVPGNPYEDGWIIDSAFKTEKDPNGFTVLTATRSGLSSASVAACYSPVIHGIKKGDVFTISFDFMTEDVSALDVQMILAINVYDGSSRLQYTDCYIGAVFGNPTIKSGEWQRLKTVFTITADTTETTVLNIRPVLYKNGNVNFSRFKVERGTINNPIYSVSPIDLSVGHINDLTTGFNLLRGTKDFRLGIVSTNNTNIYEDGWAVSNADRIIFEDYNGFKVAHGNNATASATLYSPIINDVKYGEVFTIQFEIKVDDSLFEANTWLFNINETNEETPGRIKYSDLTRTQLNISEDDVDEWKTITYRYTIVNQAATQLYMTFALGYQKLRYIRKVLVYRGDINHPIWSPSPFDIDYINDKTTGINLLRGTRDFKLGVTTFDSRRFTDGFNLMSATTTKDEDGFYYATSTGGSSSIYTNVIAGLKKGDKVTFSFMVMMNDVSKITADSVNILDIEEVTTTETTKTTYKSLSALGFSKETMQNGVWYPVQVVYEVSSNDVYIDVLIRDFHGDGFGLNIKMPKAECGVINHSIWSPSPFDLVQEHDFEQINDNTTAVNLLRGTRDFKRGTIKKLGNDLFFEDGFYLSSVGLNNSTILEDPNGFKYVCLSQTTTANSEWWGSGVAGAKKGEWYTVYFDFMVDDPSTYNFDDQYNCHICFRGKDGYQSWMGQVSLKISSQFDPSKIEAGKWYTFSHSFEITADSGEYGLIIPLVRQALPGTINYAKIGLCKGKVNHPIWSNSPLDEALEPVNDLTTGINLIRETRDFTFGSSKLGTSDYFTDGWYYTAGHWDFSKDENGFTIAQCIYAGTGTTFLYALSTQKIQPGDEFTLYFEFMNPQGTLPSGNTLVSVSEISESTAALAILDIRYENLGVNKNDVKVGQWYKASYRFTIPSTVTPGRSLRIALAAQNVTSANQLAFRKVCLIEGHINNPIWSISPFDISKINDETTGLNLLRGTRDFVFGTGQRTFGYYEDGFALVSTQKLTLDENGFSVLTSSRDDGVTGTDYAQSSKIKGIIPGETITISFDMKLHGEVPVSSTAVRVFLYNKNTTGLTAGYVKDAAVTIQTLVGTSPKADSWIPCQIKFDVPDTVDASDDQLFIGILIYTKTSTIKGNVSYRKLCASHGNINNLIWSASPFDVASISIENNGPALLGDLANTITSGDDLNNFTTAGTYYCNSDSNASKVINIPNNLALAFKLFVITTGGNVIQKILTRDNREYSRLLPNAWTNETIKSVTTIEGGGTGGNTVESAQDNLRIFTASPTNAADLNSISKGLHVTSTGLPTKNVPLNRYYLVDQLQNASSSWKFQFAASTNVNPSIHVRNSINSSNWNNWVQVLTDADYPYNPGTYVGSSIAAAHKDEIGSNHVANWISSKVSQGDFTGLNIGDYVDINCGGTTRRFAIAAIDPYYNYGTQAMPHHIAMALVNGAWKLSSSLDGSYAVNNNHVLWKSDAYNNGSTTKQNPYSDSMLHAWEIEKALTQFPQEWQDVMIERYALMESKFSASSTLNDATGIVWTNLGKIWSFSEVELFGRICQSSLKYSCASDTPFPLFSKVGSISTFTGKNQIWLRNTVEGSSSAVCILTTAGGINIAPANNNTVFAYPGFFIG